MNLFTPLQMAVILIMIIPVQLAAQADEVVAVEYSIRTPLPRRTLMIDIRNEYYVSLEGKDQNPGTKEKPFRHIQTCADIMQPGDICFVRKGTYREIVRPELRDPDNFDFRPLEGSSLIDAGKVMPGLTDHFEGQAPDIGAYEHGGINWKPGYTPKHAQFYTDYIRKHREVDFPALE